MNQFLNELWSEHDTTVIGPSLLNLPHAGQTATEVSSSSRPPTEGSTTTVDGPTYRDKTVDDETLGVVQRIEETRSERSRHFTLLPLPIYVIVCIV